MFLDYNKSREYDLESVSLCTRIGTYCGRGLMRWDSEDGFKIDAFLTRSGPPLPPTRAYRDHFIVQRSDTCTIRMKVRRGGGYDWAVVPGYHFLDNWNLIENDRLHIKSNCALFGSKQPVNVRFLDYHGHALFHTTDLLRLPGTVEKLIVVDKRQVTSRSIGGFTYKDEHQDLAFIPIDNRTLSVRWSLNPAYWSRREAWRWPEAAEVALSILYGHSVRLVHRSVQRDKHSFEEWRSCRPLTDLGLLSPCGSFVRHEPRRIVDLIGFLVGWHKTADICRRILQQLCEARQQQTNHAQELLCGTILEAILRTLDNACFENRRAQWSISASLEAFRRERLDTSWREACDSAIHSFRRLRHRNAHPDWIAEENGALSRRNLARSLDDMIYLCRFYGHMILALAGFPIQTPEFPRQYASWGPWMTVAERPES